MYSVSPLGDVKLVHPTTEAARAEDGESPSRGTRRRSSTWSPQSASRRSSKTVMRLKSFIKQPEADKFPRGIVVQCNDLECIFEFKVYKYIGRYHADDDSSSKSSSVPPEPPLTNDQVHAENENHSQCNDVTGSASSTCQAEVTSPNIPLNLQSPLQPENAPSPWSEGASSIRSSPTLQCHGEQFDNNVSRRGSQSPLNDNGTGHDNDQQLNIAASGGVPYESDDMIRTAL